MSNFLRKQLPRTAVMALVAITTIIAGCLPANTSRPAQPAYTSRPAAEKTYQSVSSTKLGLSSFATEYYGKDVETDVTFVTRFPQSAPWAPSGLRTTDWIAVQAGEHIGLVVPKTSSCSDVILSAQLNTPIHLWGTVHAPVNSMVGSVIAVDKCR